MENSRERLLEEIREKNFSPYDPRARCARGGGGRKSSRSVVGSASHTLLKRIGNLQFLAFVERRLVALAEENFFERRAELGVEDVVEDGIEGAVEVAEPEED
jgi:hypothetical protein